MKDIIEILERWTGEGTAVALGSVVERIGSAPRDPGATLAVSSKHEVAGGVTGGCVEPAVIREAMEVLDGAPGRLVHYGLDDDDGFDVGLNCGGKIAVAVYRLDPKLVPPIAEAVRTDRPIALTSGSTTTRFGEQAIYSPNGGMNGNGADAAASAAARIRCSRSARARSSRPPTARRSSSSRTRRVPSSTSSERATMWPRSFRSASSSATASPSATRAPSS